MIKFKDFVRVNHGHIADKPIEEMTEEEYKEYMYWRNEYKEAIAYGDN